VIEVECEARDARAIDTLVQHLEGAGFHVERAELD
jgi:threonine dehydratase